MFSNIVQFANEFLHEVYRVKPCCSLLACSQTLYFLFKIRRTWVIKYKPQGPMLLKRTKRKIKQRLITGQFPLACQLETLMIKTNTSKSRTYELSEQNSEEKSDLNFPADLGSQALLLQEFNEETESRHHDFYVFTMTLSLRITSNDFPFFHQ